MNLLRELGKEKGIFGQIFTKSQNKIQDPAKLFKLIDMIGKETWTVLGADVKGEIYERLLKKTSTTQRAVPGNTSRRVL